MGGVATLGRLYRQRPEQLGRGAVAPTDSDGTAQHLGPHLMPAAVAEQLPASAAAANQATTEEVEVLP